MGAFFKHKWYVLVANLIIILLGFLLFSRTYTWVNFINAFFYITFVYMMVWLFLVVTRGGFFDGIAFGFRRFRLIMSKHPNYLEEMDDKPALSERIKREFYQHIRFQAFMLVMLLLVMLVIYYI